MLSIKCHASLRLMLGSKQAWRVWLPPVPIFTPLGTQEWDEQELSLPRHDCMLTLRLDGRYTPKVNNEGIFAAERTIYGARRRLPNRGGLSQARIAVMN